MEDWPEEQDGLSSASLREATLAGMRWVFLARVVAEITLFGSTIVLARLISPAEFGRAAIALIFTTLAGTLIGGIAGPLLIQRATIERAHREASAWLSVAIGLTLATATFMVAPVLIKPLFDGRTAELVRLASPAFLIVAISVTPQALLQRRLAFRRLSQIEIVAALLGSAASVGLALAGLGGEAIVLGTLVGLALSSLGFLLSAEPTKPGWRPRELLELARFGVPAAIASLGTLAYGNIDYAIVGARLGPSRLGIYWRAYQLGAEYQGKISTIMLRLAFPVFSRSADAEHMRRMRRRIMRMHATIIIPLLALLVAVAPQLIPLMYGDAWRAAVRPTQILALAGASAALLTGIGPLMMATGKLWRLTVLTWVSVAFYALVIYVASPYGLVAVSIVSAATITLILFVSSYLLASQQVGIPLSSLWEEAGPAVLASAVQLAITLSVASWLRQTGLPPALSILIVAAIGLPAYLIVVRRISPRTWSDLLLIRSRVLGIGR